MKVARRMAQGRFRSKKIRFLVDECASSCIILNGLKAVGHDIESAIDMAGSEDHALLSYANETQRVIITLDSDFGTLIFRDGLPTYGVIYLKGWAQSNRRSMLMPHLVHQVKLLGRSVVGTFTQIEADRTGAMVKVEQKYLTMAA